MCILENSRFFFAKMRKKFSQLHFVLSCVHFGETILSIALCIMWCILENFQFYKNSFLFFAKIAKQFLNCSLYNVCILENSRFHENSSFAKMQNNSLNCTLYNVCILENSRFHENSSFAKMQNNSLNCTLYYVCILEILKMVAEVGDFTIFPFYFQM